MNEELKKFTEPQKVLHDGFVRLVEVMGDDSSIVQAARVSYGAGTKSYRQDRALIRYLLRNRHTSPLEMCEIKFHFRVPMDEWRQHIRHRTANVNEMSTRYSVAIDTAEVSHRWRKQSKDNKQGSSQEDFTVDESKWLSAREEALHTFAREVYDERLEMGVAREQARKDLPLSTYTEAYWKIDLHNLLHFLNLRQHFHAQEEIRLVADKMAEITEAWVPLAYEAYVDYIRESENFSRMEMQALREIVSLHREKGHLLEDDEYLRGLGMSSRELKEFRSKLNYD